MAATAPRGRSALATYRRKRAPELAAWARTLPWRAAVVLAVAAGAALLTAAAGLHRAAPLLAGLGAGAVVGWRLRFRVSRDTRAWWDGARGERATARLLRRLARHGSVMFHDVAIPGTPANTGRWWISDQD
jgi:putative intracellular protease/amidase